MRKPFIAGMLLAVAIPGVSVAATPDHFLVRSAADLVEVCRSVPSDTISSAAAGFCQGYVVGIYRTLEEVQAAGSSGRMFCVDESQHPPSRTEAITAYVAWIDAKPERLSQPSVESVAAYLADTYPCSGSGSSTSSRSRVQ